MRKTDVTTTEGVLERDGLRIPYVVDASAGGRRIVYAHGIHGRGEFGRQSVAPLVEHGWTVVTFDQRGHCGATPVTDPAQYEPAPMGGDLLAILDDLGWDTAWIGGESMGAATSIAAAFMHRERIEGLVQVVPAITEKPNEAAAAGFPAMADVLERDGIDAVIKTTAEQIRSLGGSEDQIARLEDLRVHDEASLACIWRTVPRWTMSEVPGRVGEFDFPVLVAGWRNEPIHPFEIAEAIAAQAKNSVLVEFSLDEFLKDRGTIGRAIANPLEKLL
jgi:pimeloyl-ACP methyl ester carboxylesterase